MTRRQIEGTTRESLQQDVEFLRFLAERQADAQRDADRCQTEVDTWMEMIDSKRREQAENLRIVEACVAGLAINNRINRPAPQLTPKPEEPVIDGSLHGEGE